MKTFDRLMRQISTVAGFFRPADWAYEVQHVSGTRMIMLTYHCGDEHVSHQFTIEGLHYHTDVQARLLWVSHTVQDLIRLMFEKRLLEGYFD